MKYFHLSLAIAAVSATTTSVSAFDAAETWNQYCKKCHAEDGSGNTRMGKKLMVQDYTDPAVQAKMTDVTITQAIMKGIDDADGKRLMPPFAEKIEAADLPALIAYLRTFQKDA